MFFKGLPSKREVNVGFARTGDAMEKTGGGSGLL